MAISVSELLLRLQDVAPHVVLHVVNQKVL